MEKMKKYEYDPSLRVPHHISAAAQMIADYAAEQGWKDWMIGPVADRDLVERLLQDPKQHFDTFR